VITGIVVALQEELGTLSRLPGFARERKIAKGSYALAADNMAVVYSGAGPKNAQSAAELLVANGATRLISWGCAAALNETLKAGDLVLANALIDANNHKIDIKSEWHSHATSQLLQNFAVYMGCLVESKNIVSSTEDKKKLRSKTGAIALDMESIAIAKVAGQHNLPFLAIRAIADTAGMNLPKSINYALNDLGDIALGRLLFHLALHPSELPGLINTGFCFSAAKNTLKLVAKHLNTVIDFNGGYAQQPV
jgi:adenosylhomocysteine nucleosidase